MKYSIIVPVYNRPDEVDELLESLSNQTLKDFEVIVVEDGSGKPCKDVCDKYADILALHYHTKENSGPGQSRNYGAERAKGEWLIILDSDVVLPEGYLAATDVADYLAKKGLPFRRAHEVVGHLVHTCEQRGCDLSDLSLEDFKAECPLFEGDITEQLDLPSIVAARTVAGGTGHAAVRMPLQQAMGALAEDRDVL